MTIYTPFTYLIGWTSQKKYYYGVRYAIDTTPSDLWVKYHTSSSSVKLFREEYGEPDVIQVRKTFDSADAARKWEEKVMRRMGVVVSQSWLNQNDTQAPPIHTGRDMRSWANTLKGVDRTEAQKTATASLSRKLKGRKANNMVPVLLWGVRYESGRHAMKELNLSSTALHYARLNHRKFGDVDDMNEFVWKERNNKISSSKSKKVIIDGVVYGSVRTVMKELKMGRTRILRLNETTG